MLTPILIPILFLFLYSSLNHKTKFKKAMITLEIKVKDEIILKNRTKKQDFPYTTGKNYKVYLIDSDNDSFLIRNDNGEPSWIDFDNTLILE